MHPYQETEIVIPTDLLASLNAAFDVLRFENDEHLSSNVMQYIQDGRNEQALGERLAKQPLAPSLLYSYGSGQSLDEANKKTRLNWLQRDDVSPLFFRRIAFVLHSRTFFAATEPAQRFPTAYKLVGEWQACLGYSNKIDQSTFRRWLNADMEVEDSALVDLLLESCGKTEEYVLRFHMGRVSGWLPILNQYTTQIDQFLSTKPVSEQVELIKYLDQQAYDFTSHHGTLTRALGKSASRELRTAVVTLLRRDITTTIPMLQELLSEKAASTRKNAIESLFELDPIAANTIVLKHLPNEKSSGIKEFIENILILHASSGEPQEQIGEGDPSQATAIDIELDAVPIDADSWSSFESRLQEYVLKEQKDFVAQRRSFSSHYNAMTDEHILGAQWKGETYATRLEELRKTMENGVEFQPKGETYGFWHVINRLFSFFVAEPTVAGIRLIHIIRLHYLGNHDDYSSDSKLVTAIERYLPNETAIRQDFSLAHIAHIEGSMPGKSVSNVLIDYLNLLGRDGLAFGMDAEQVWPTYFAHPQAIQLLLQQSISGGTNDLQVEVLRGATLVLSHFPSFSSDLTNLLWQYALSEKKPVRKEIQKLLTPATDFVDRIKTAMKSKQGPTREAAYLWLAFCKRRDLTSELEEAFQKERSEPLKVHVLKALEAVDADLSKLLDRSELMAEAEAGLKKIRVELKWLLWKEMPVLHWRGTTEPIPELIVRWWILQVVVLKNPVASPLLRRWLDQCDAKEIGLFANWLFSQWIERSIFSASSVLPDKGILAIPGCVCDNGMLTTAHAYLKEQYGFKIGECRALLDMASGSDRPEALHFLKKISHGFRTKSIQAHAQKLIEQAAELRGWTPSEFADRVIPDGGFVLADRGSTAEESLPDFAKGHPTLELDFGSRTIYAILNDELECVVMTSEGKTLKKLPDGTQSDDNEKVAFAKKQFNAGKKAIKDVVTVETHRLSEAMWVERYWHARDWTAFLQKHAVLGKMVQRIVWTAWSSDESKTLLGSFRPLADGTLVTNNESAFALPEGCLVKIGNGFDLGPNEVHQWRSHLDDYEVIPLLRQFNPPKQFTPEQLDQESIDDFLGYRIEYFKFKRLAEKLGYLRGQSGDGGRFFEFKKSISSAALEVVLHFSGNYLPEQPGLIALESIRFIKKRANIVHVDSYSKGEKRKKVPRLLWSECFFDLQQLSEAGIGFSEDWKTDLVF